MGSTTFYYFYNKTNDGTALLASHRMNAVVLLQLSFLFSFSFLMSLLIVTMLFLHSCQLCGAGKAAIVFTSAIFLHLFIACYNLIKLGYIYILFNVHLPQFLKNQSQHNDFW
jgi:hypothetical protein